MVMWGSPGSVRWGRTCPGAPLQTQGCRVYALWCDITIHDCPCGSSVQVVRKSVSKYICTNKQKHTPVLLSMRKPWGSIHVSTLHLYAFTLYAFTHMCTHVCPHTCALVHAEAVGLDPCIHAPLVHPNGQVSLEHDAP